MSGRRGRKRCVGGGHVEFRWIVHGALWMFLGTSGSGGEWNTSVCENINQSTGLDQENTVLKTPRHRGSCGTRARWKDRMLMLREVPGLVSNTTIEAQFVFPNSWMPPQGVVGAVNYVLCG